MTTTSNEMRDLLSFLLAANTNAAIASQISQALTTLNNNHEAMVAVGAKHGYHFSVNTLTELRSNLTFKLTPPEMQTTSRAMGEEGKGRPSDGGAVATTLAMGEEGKGRPSDGGAVATTLALGEEGDRPWDRDDNQPIATTLALGEEGNDRPSGGDTPATTLALGEEGNDRPSGGDTPATTLALGEEGKGRPFDGGAPATTLALGEESKGPKNG